MKTNYFNDRRYDYTNVNECFQVSEPDGDRRTFGYGWQNPVATHPIPVALAAVCVWIFMAFSTDSLEPCAIAVFLNWTLNWLLKRQTDH